MRIGNIEIKRLRGVTMIADDEIMLTSAGKEAAEEGKYIDSRGRILDNLNSGGQNSVRDLANECRLPVDKVKACVTDLCRKGLTRIARGYDNDNAPDIDNPLKPMPGF